MSVGIICCKVLEKEIKQLVRNAPEVCHLEVMDWGLHTQPDLLKKTLCRRIEVLQNEVQAIVLGYGRCQALDKIPRNYKVPVYYPQAEDCIGVLLGQKRYEQELMNEAGTWFLTPGWTEMGMESVFHELQLNHLAQKNIDPLKVAHRMLKDYTRALFIDTQVGDPEQLLERAQIIANEFHLRLETTQGSLVQLENTLKQALSRSALTHQPGLS
jgi:hypothetical protein